MRTCCSHPYLVGWIWRGYVLKKKIGLRMPEIPFAMTPILNILLGGCPQIPYQGPPWVAHIPFSKILYSPQSYVI